MSDPDPEVRSRALSRSAVYRLLADARRRTVLDVVAVRETPILLENLARAVAAREEEAAPAAVSADRVERVAVSLHHAHLPKLADHGVVEYDTATETVDAGANFEVVAAWSDEAVQ